MNASSLSSWTKMERKESWEFYRYVHPKHPQVQFQFFHHPRWITAVNYDFEEEGGTDTRHQSFPELLYSVKGGGDFYRTFYHQDITLIANDFVQLINYCTLLCSRGRKFFRFERESVGRSRLNWIASFGRESFGGEKSGELLGVSWKGGKRVVKIARNRCRGKDRGETMALGKQ